MKDSPQNQFTAQLLPDLRKSYRTPTRPSAVSVSALVGMPIEFYLEVLCFFLNSSRKVLRRFPTISDDGVLPNPSHFVFYKNLSIQLYGPKTSAVQQTPLNYDTDIFL